MYRVRQARPDLRLWILNIAFLKENHHPSEIRGSRNCLNIPNLAWIYDSPNSFREIRGQLRNVSFAKSLDSCVTTDHQGRNQAGSNISPDPCCLGCISVVSLGGKLAGDG